MAAQTACTSGLTTRLPACPLPVLCAPSLRQDRFLCSFGHIFAGGYAAGELNLRMPYQLLVLGLTPPRACLVLWCLSIRLLLVQVRAGHSEMLVTPSR